MPFELNEKIKSLEPYEPVVGEYRIRLDANESFIPPADEVMNDIKAAVEALHFNRYPDSPAAALCASANLYPQFTNIFARGRVSMRLFEPAQGGALSSALED